MKSPPDNSLRSDLKTFGVGLCMGAADIVPGVSGGTVALILGVYRRLLSAISGANTQTAGALLAGRWGEAAERLDARFLFALGGGVLVGAGALAGLMEHLLEHHRAVTYSAFFGLILASGYLVGRMCSPPSRRAAVVCVVLGLLAALFALALVMQQHVTPPGGMLYLFICGAVAICAMILPGISGAYLLLMLGLYEDVTGVIKRLPRGQATGDDLLMLAVFACGCLVGLLLFSRLLRWLLDRYSAPTLAVLCGFMIGSLYRLWPFQIDATPDVEEFKHKLFEPYLPGADESQLAVCVLTALACCAGVLLLDHWAGRLKASQLSD
ncbi:DUF368 domain-containing protein [Pseudobythopirellula maris]|nr:DUF368 domain-containing protein [Pseudobythopirellula maris]